MYQDMKFSVLMSVYSDDVPEQLDAAIARVGSSICLPANSSQYSLMVAYTMLSGKLYEIGSSFNNLATYKVRKSIL